MIRIGTILLLTIISVQVPLYSQSPKVDPKKIESPSKAATTEDKEAGTEKTGKNESAVVSENAEKMDEKSTQEIAEVPGEAESQNLFSTVSQGGPVMIFIILLGMIGCTIIIERSIFYYKRKSWKRISLVNYLEESASKSKAHFKEQLEDEIRDAFQLYITRIEKGMALLNGIGNIAPIVGFLGTVVGMIKAFAAIAAATTVNAKVVAVGIQIALVTTAGGLFVAAPLLAYFHFVNHMVQNLMLHGEEFITERASGLPSMLKKGSK